jgi:CheY-like chemotaxis protein
LGPRVLVVEDNPSVAALLSVIVSPDAEVLEARDGESAWEMLLTHRPELAILDRRIPGRTGDDVCAAARRAPELAGLKIIALSSSYRGVRRATEDECPDYFVGKPFSPAQLSAVVRELIS